MERTIVAEPALDLDSRERFREAAEQQLRYLQDGDVLVVDLSATQTVDSAGLGTLVTVQRVVTHTGATVRLRGVRPEVRVLLTLTRLADLFDVEPAEPA